MELAVDDDFVLRPVRTDDAETLGERWTGTFKIKALLEFPNGGSYRCHLGPIDGHAQK